METREPATGLEQPLDGARNRARVAVGLGAERQPAVRRGLGDAGDRRLRPAVEYRLVFGHGHAVGGIVERLEVGVGGAAVVVT